MIDPVTDPETARAQAEAAAARRRLMSTVGEVKARLAPATIAADAMLTARARGLAAARDLEAAVRRKPARAAAIAGGIALFIVRRPVARAVKRLFSRRRATAEADEG